MATIKISDLNPAGSSFFADSESYLTDLSDDEIGETQGGKTWTSSVILSSPKCAVTIAIATLITAATYGAYRGWKAA